MVLKWVQPIFNMTDSTSESSTGLETSGSIMENKLKAKTKAPALASGDINEVLLIISDFHSVISIS